MSLLIAALCLAFFAAVLILVTQNDALVDVNLLFGSLQQVPVSLIMVACLGAGVGFAALISFLDGLRLRLQNRSLRRELGRMEGDLEKLQKPAPAGRAAESSSLTPPRDFSGG